MKQNSILVVDDEQHMIDAISNALTLDGYDVHPALSGEAALEALKSMNFDLIISDQKMNGMTGTALFKKAKEICPDTIRILLTAYTENDIFMEAINKGEIYRFIAKPFEVSTLMIEIKNALKQKVLIEEKEKLTNRLQEKERFEGVIINSRNKLMAIFDTIHENLFSVDPDYNIVSANRVFSDEFGKEAKKIVGQKCYMVKHGLDAPCFEYGYDCPVRDVFESGAPYSSTSVYMDSAGRKRHNDFSVLPVKKSGGEVVQVVKISRDITKEKESAEKIRSLNKELTKALSEVREKNVNLEKSVNKLQETQAQLLQSEKMASIGQLAAGVAHEINNPVGFIISNLSSLKSYVSDLSLLIHKYEELKKEASTCLEGEKDEKLSTLLEAINQCKEEIDYDFVMNDLDNLISESQEGAERVKKIVLDLKDFSHVDKAELQYSDINKGIESTLNIVWNELKYKAKVRKDFGNLPEVYCYPQKLNQVFMNLLVNAAQAIEKKGEIRISTRFCDSGDPYVEIKISDTGSGIPEDALPKIFDPFFTTKPVGEGTGLGLNMAYSIIKKHHGRIDVESEVSKGTTFTIVLPVLDET